MIIRRRYGIKKLIYEEIECTVKQIKKSEDGLLKYCRPVLNCDQIKIIQQMVEDKVYCLLKKIQTTNTDAEFLLNLKRDWEDDCPICLDNPEETAMFRPCGHSICISPCLSLLVAKMGLNCPICRCQITNVFDPLVTDTSKLLDHKEIESLIDEILLEI